MNWESVSRIKKKSNKICLFVAISSSLRSSLTSLDNPVPSHFQSSHSACIDSLHLSFHLGHFPSCMHSHPCTSQILIPPPSSSLSVHTPVFCLSGLSVRVFALAMPGSVDRCVSFSRKEHWNLLSYHQLRTCCKSIFLSVTCCQPSCDPHHVPELTYLHNPHPAIFFFDNGWTTFTHAFNLLH